MCASTAALTSAAPVLDQVDLDRCRRPVLEREPQHDRQERRKAVDPEDPRRLAVEVAEPDQVELEERRRSQHKALCTFESVETRMRLDSARMRSSPLASSGPSVPSAWRLRPGRLHVVAEVAAGERDEDVFEADVPRREAGQRPVEAVELVEQGGDRAMRLGDGQDVAVVFDPRGQDRVEPEQRVQFERPRRGALFEGELDDVVAAQPGDQLGGRAQGDDLPWSMIATRSQSRSASSM